MTQACQCRPCRAQRAFRYWGRRLLVGVVVLTLVGSPLLGLGVLAQRAIFPPERAVWFANLLTLATKANLAYQREPAVDGRPRDWTEFYEQVKEIVYQIEEENASLQLVDPTGFAFVDYGPGRRSAVAGSYSSVRGNIVLNERFIQAAWGDQSFLSVLIHEIVHSQGYFVGTSETLESQTEIVATEVLAAMANLNYPGARRELLDGLRRDALTMAYYLARFDGDPHHTTYGAYPVASPWNDGDPDLLAEWERVRASIFTPAELARSDKRIRWWLERPEEYVQVLAKYVVTTTTMELDAACGSGRIGENFLQYDYLGIQDQLAWDRASRTWVMAPFAAWGDIIALPPLEMDDLAYVLGGLGYC